MTHARVRDVMTSDVITVAPATPYKDIAARLRGSRVSAFPVLDAVGRVAGVVSAADLLAKVSHGETEARRPWFSAVRDRQEHAKAAGVTAADLMTSPAITIGPDELVSAAARLMSARRVERLPVVSADGRLAGIISRSDVLAVFRRPDEDIYAEIARDVITDGFFMDPAIFRVTVEDGIVTLDSSPATEAVAREIAERARHVEGVVAVRERPAA